MGKAAKVYLDTNHTEYFTKQKRYNAHRRGTVSRKKNPDSTKNRQDNLLYGIAYYKLKLLKEQQ